MSRADDPVLAAVVVTFDGHLEIRNNLGAAMPMQDFLRLLADAVEAGVMPITGVDEQENA